MNRSHPQNVPQQNRWDTFSPTEGQPFPFRKLSDGPTILKAILCHPALCPGAKLLWGVIRHWSKAGATCYARTVRFAEALNVSVDQVKKYKRELIGAGLLQVRERPGSTMALQLLWHRCFLDESEYEGVRKRHPKGGADMHGVRVLSAPPIGNTPKLYKPKRVVVSSVSSSVGTQNRRDDDPKTGPENDDHPARKVVRTAKEKTSQEDTTRQLTLAIPELVHVIELAGAPPPDEEITIRICNMLDQANRTVADYGVQIATRAKRLAAPPGPGFFLKTARDFCNGKLDRLPSQRQQRRLDKIKPGQCDFCEFRLGGGGQCCVLPTGEILSGGEAQRLDRAGELPEFTTTACPVCSVPSDQAIPISARDPRTA